MKNSGKFQKSMRAVTINSEFSLPGLMQSYMRHFILDHPEELTETNNIMYDT